MRLASWVNVVLSMTLVFFSSDKFAASLVAVFWIVAVFAVTHTLAWLWERKPDPALERSSS